MIQRAVITAWRSTAPWATDAQIEQDLLSCRPPVEIYSDPLPARTLAFRGGTALHKLFLTPPSRCSEDRLWHPPDPTRRPARNRKRNGGVTSRLASSPPRGGAQRQLPPHPGR